MLSTGRACASALQCICVAVCCSVLQCVAVCCSVASHVQGGPATLHNAATHYNTMHTLQHNAHIATHGNPWQHTARHGLQHNANIATHSNTWQHTANNCNVLQHGLGYSETQHNAPHCTTQQHAATRYNRLRAPTCAAALGPATSRVLCCSVLQFVSVLQCVAVCCRVLPCGAVCCSVLQCVAVCCSVLQCFAVCCNVFVRYSV